MGGHRKAGVTDLQTEEGHQGSDAGQAVRREGEPSETRGSSLCLRLSARAPPAPSLVSSCFCSGLSSAVTALWGSLRANRMMRGGVRPGPQRGCIRE